MPTIEGAEPDHNERLWPDTPKHLNLAGADVNRGWVVRRVRQIEFDNPVDAIGPTGPWVVLFSIWMSQSGPQLAYHAHLPATKQGLVNLRDAIDKFVEADDFPI